MANSDTELIQEVRSLTDYTSSIISDGDMQELVGIAKAEIEIDVSNSIDDFYANPIAERALFWLLCIFSKIKTGEYEGMNLTISEIEVTQFTQNEKGRIWTKNFNKRLRQLSAGNRTYVASMSRSGRSYSDERQTANDSQ